MAGRSQSIYRVEVETKPLPQGGFKALVESETARIQALRRPEGHAQTVIRTVDLPANIKGIWYFWNPDDANLRELEGIKQAGDHAVVATRSSLADKEAGVEKLLSDVVASYVPGLMQGFCLGGGFLTIENGRNEDAGINFVHRQIPRFEIGFDTQTVSEPDTHSYSSYDEEKQVIEGNGGSMSVLKDHELTVAGLGGKEMWLSAKSPNDPSFVRFTWHYPGVAFNSFQPMINIVATAPVEEQQRLEVIWDGLLKSLRPIPAAAAR